tara:strand:- start:42 stop:464 length:423 start_codon:yes stop_codon:yes gene_type:complete
MFRNNQTSSSGGSVGWTIDASKILEGSDFDLSAQTLTNLPSSPGTYGRLSRRGGIFQYTNNNATISYLSSDPATAWKVAGGLELATLADISDATSAVNTIGKFSGKQVFESNTPRVMIAGTSGATGVWYVVDGSASVTPA